MKHLALFNGIGGFQLAASWCGCENVAHVEIDDFCNKVIAKRFPNSKCFYDINLFDGTQYRNTIDIITGGFPCQPFSVAGKQRGKKDGRYLWPQMFRVICEVQPPFVVAENVPGLINQGRGLVLKQILSDLETQGYEVLPFLIPAIGVGACHKRERIWIIAYSKHYGHLAAQKSTSNGSINDYPPQGTNQNIQSTRVRSTVYFCDPFSSRLGGHNWRWTRQKLENRYVYVSDSNSTWQLQPKRSIENIWQRLSHNSEIISNSNRLRIIKSSKRHKAKLTNQDGQTRRATTDTHSQQRKKQLRAFAIKSQYRSIRCSSWWSFEPRLGRVAHGVPNRVDRLKSLGNAIVPQVAYQIFKAIIKFNENNTQNN